MDKKENRKSWGPGQVAGKGDKGMQKSSSVTNDLSELDMDLRKLRLNLSRGEKESQSSNMGKNPGDKKVKVDKGLTGKIKANAPKYEDMATSVKQQAAKESNFVGDCYFYNLSLPKLREQLAGSYLIVYTRPKTSQSYKRGDRREVFAPSSSDMIENSQKIIQLDTGREEDQSSVPEEADLVRYLIDHQGYWGVGQFTFNNTIVMMLFEVPNKYNKTVSTVVTDGTRELEGKTDVKNTTFLENVLAKGVRKEGSTARFGIKHMCDMHGKTYGFYFVMLDLAVTNMKTKKPDIHHVVAVKLPGQGRNVPVAFLLKQMILIAPYDANFTVWSKLSGEGELRRKSLKALNNPKDEEPDYSDCYEEEPQPSQGRPKRSTGFEVLEEVDIPKLFSWKG